MEHHIPLENEIIYETMNLLLQMNISNWVINNYIIIYYIIIVIKINNFIIFLILQIHILISFIIK